MDRLKEKPVRALGVILERGWRIAAQAQCVLRHDRSDRFRTTEQPVAGCPAPAPALVSSSERSGEKRICGDQISGRADAFFSLSLKTAENGEIVFGFIDGVGGISWGRPSEPCVSWPYRLGAQSSAKSRQMTFRSPKGFKVSKDRWSGHGLGRGQGRNRRNTIRRSAAPATSASARRSCSTRVSFVARPPICSRTRSRKIGSSTILRREHHSASPGTNTVSKLMPRAAIDWGDERLFP